MHPQGKDTKHTLRKRKRKRKPTPTKNLSGNRKEHPPYQNRDLCINQIPHRKKTLKP